MFIKRTTVDTKKNLLKLYWGIKKIKFGHIGYNVRIVFQGSFFGNPQNMFIDNDVFIARDNYFDAVSEIHIGSGTMIGPRCTFIGGSHNYDSIDMKSVPYDNVILNRTIVIDKNVWIAANVMVCPGCHIGEGSVIGAGACVYGEIPPYSVVVSPGYKIVKRRDSERYRTLDAQRKIYNLRFAEKPFEKKKG